MVSMITLVQRNHFNLKIDFDIGRTFTNCVSSQPGISQMIWKSTEYIGVGVAWDSNGKVVIVAHYKPAGNIAGYFAENVSVIDPIKHAGSTVTVPSKSRVTE